MGHLGKSQTRKTISHRQPQALPSLKPYLPSVEGLQGMIGNRAVGHLIESHHHNSQPTPNSLCPLLSSVSTASGQTIQLQPSFRGLSHELMGVGMKAKHNQVVQRKPTIKGKAKTSAFSSLPNIQLSRDRTKGRGNSDTGQAEEIEMVSLRPDGREDVPYYNHPSFPIWERLCQEAGLTEEEIHQSFMDVMGGVRAGLEAKNPLRSEEKRSEAQQVLRELMEKFAKGRTKELQTPPGGLVLWSGCKELASEYAKKINGKALADTAVGQAIDAVELWSEAKDYAIGYWDILGPFWEEVSRQLAKTSIGDVTVIVTNSRENTVFHRVEKFALKHDQKVRFFKAAPIAEGSQKFQIVSGPYESWKEIKPHLAGST